MKQKLLSKLNSKETVEVHLGAAGTLIGNLTFVRQGSRELSQFNYDESWLMHPDVFEVSPDLPLGTSYYTRKAPSNADSVFHFALADTAPDAWGRRVIERAHAKARKKDPTLAPLSELDYLCAVDDFSRIGALRLHSGSKYLQTIEAGRRNTPPLVALGRMYAASRAIENNQETAEDLRYLQGKGTSLGGMRPKCTVLDEDGALALGKFPSVGDTINVTRGEVLALHLATKAGINTAQARIVTVQGEPIAVIRRFDRTDQDARIPYLSAASMLQASRGDPSINYTDLVDVIRQRSPHPDKDARELWRRLVFNILITNTDDHLHNHGFLYAGKNRWELAPAFDINPMPNKLRESKTWLDADSGPIQSVSMLMDGCAYFSLTKTQAQAVLAEVLDAVLTWREVAVGADIGLTTDELPQFEDAFEHDVTNEARTILGRPLHRPERG